MKAAYPITLTKGEKYVLVYVPDFDINTQGKDMADALEMARDAIGLLGIDMEDDGEKIPFPSNYLEVVNNFQNESTFVTLVDVDFAEYRRQNEIKTVRRNVSLPSWLNDAADRAGLNVSAVLQSALKKELKIKRV